MFGNKLSKIEKLKIKDKALKIIPMLNDRDEDVVLAAIEALGHSSKDEAFNTLVPLVHSPNEKVRTAAALALGETGRTVARVHLEHQRKVEASDAVKNAISRALTALPASD